MGRNIAWAAGIFEGEGNITIRTLRRENRELNPCVIMQVTNTDVDTIEEFKRIVKLGRIRGPYKSPSRGDKRKPIWQWAASGKEARIVLYKLRPYLLSRRSKRADEALKCIDTMYPRV